jgi:hypothetical protein
MRISRHDLRRRYSNPLVIDAGSHFTLRTCSQAKSRVDWIVWLNVSNIVFTSPSLKIDNKMSCELLAGSVMNKLGE